jgi:C-terminal processing protease CtpA/Prc
MHCDEGKTQKKEISLIKSSEFVGITLCNENGKVIIRHISPCSIAAGASHAIRKGDAIEKINGESVTLLNILKFLFKFRWLVKIIEKLLKNLNLLL